MTACSVPPPPKPFPPCGRSAVAAGTQLHRTHAKRFRSAQFNPCEGQISRFAQFTTADGLCVPTLYAATTREAAVFESIFHDIDAAASFKTVPLSAVEARSASIIASKRELRLVSLFSPDLKAWGLERRQLIDTPKSTYPWTAIWAAAIHAAAPDADGLVWTSRQCDPERCVVLFGDRVQEDDFDVVERREIGEDAALLLEIRAYGRRAGIILVS